MPIYIKLYENKVFFRNLKTNNEYTIIADVPFSKDNLLIANLDKAIEYLKIGLKQIMPKFYFFRPKIYIQLMKNIDDISQVELRAIEEAFFRAKAREIIFIEYEYQIRS